MLLSQAAHLVPDMLGDVVISVPTARRQAKEGRRSLSEELAWLLVHGVLHLCGYDHERSDAEARRLAEEGGTWVIVDGAWQRTHNPPADPKE